MWGLLGQALGYWGCVGGVDPALQQGGGDEASPNTPIPASVDPNDQKKTACYDIDVEVDDPLKAQMSNFLASTTNQQEIASLDAKVRGLWAGTWRPHCRAGGSLVAAMSCSGWTQLPLTSCPLPRSMRPSNPSTS